MPLKVFKYKRDEGHKWWRVIGSGFLNENKRQFGAKETQLFCLFDPVFLKSDAIIEFPQDFVYVLVNDRADPDLSFRVTDQA